MNALFLLFASSMAHAGSIQNGNSVLMCRDAQSHAASVALSEAMRLLNQDLLNAQQGIEAEYTHVVGEALRLEAPFAVSAPAMNVSKVGDTMVGTICVTITRR